MSTNYADSPKPKIERAKDTIGTILVEGHKGKKNAISSKQLAEAVGLKPTTVRDVIPEIRRERHIPVVSGSKGYYVCSDQDEFAEVLARIQRTIETKEQRRRDLINAYHG